VKNDATILIIDDENDILFSLKMLLKQHFKHVYGETNPFHLPRLLSQYKPDLVLLDMNFSIGQSSGEEGITWLKKIKELQPDLPVIMMTAFGDLQLAIGTIKNGAMDFIEKPWRNEKLLATVHAGIELGKSKEALVRANSQRHIIQNDLNDSFGEILGKSESILELKKVIEKVAPTDANILLLGENGVGKELVARTIHKLSQRADKVFLGVDLGSISESLFESELFGHVKGAFTGAEKDKIGRFSAASEGTLFLDEIGNLPSNLQPKLLQAIENRQVFPVGSNLAVNVDVRIVSATNMALRKMVGENTFRQDLLYRINTVEIPIPALRERKEDIEILVEHYLTKFSSKYAKKISGVHKATIKKLNDYSWPGNVRELKHSIERAVILTEHSTLIPGDFDLRPSHTVDQDDEILNLDKMEGILVRKALAKNQGNISKAAKDLGLTRPALYRRMEKYNL